MKKQLAFVKIYGMLIQDKNKLCRKNKFFNEKNKEWNDVVWNISPECISAVMLCIIWVYSRKGSPLPTLKNRLFQVCFLVTFCSMTSNVISTLMLYHYEEIPLILTWLVTSIYFAATPLMGIVYYYYAVAVLTENKDNAGRIMAWSSPPAAVYFLMVLTNPFTKWIFDVVPGTGYVRGPAISSTYLVFYLYCAACIVATLLKGGEVDPAAKRILAIFPMVAVAVIVVQQMFPDYILSGSAATCALLLLYLYLQNKQISIDHLTGLPNRQEFLKLLDLRLQKRKDEPFTIVVLSLKNFKTVNNNFGQMGGDLFLQEAGRFFRDAAAPCPLYRYGGDEFAVLMESGEEDQIRRLVLTLLERMTSPWEIRGYSCVIPGAVGIVRYPESASRREDLISGIEFAVSQAKQDRTKSYSYCTPEMLQALSRRNKIAEILKDALRTGNFQVYYQPILSVKDGRFTLAESLLRMNETPIGPVYPNEFIPIAEETGIIVELTYLVLERVCAFLRRMTDQGVELDGISVNFSGIQFSQADVIQRVSGIIESAGVPYSKIKIEITESVVAENFEQLNGFIQEMHSRGVRFGLDDFGTGYSNISSVFCVPLDTIKLDKSLVYLSMKDSKYSLAVRQLVRVFKEFDLFVLAEGVETEEQRDFVTDCGCDMIQGFLYARPMPEEQAEQVIGREQAL